MDKKSVIKSIFGGLIIVLYIVAILYFLWGFLISANYGDFVGGSLFLVVILIIILFLGFAYKLIRGSKLLLKLLIGLIVLIVLYFAIAGIVSLTNFCPSYFNFMPSTQSGYYNPFETFLCPFADRVY